MRYPNIVLLGPPGSGKGTYAAAIKKHFNMMYISTGDILRKEVLSETELGKRIRLTMDSGQLVSDAIAVECFTKATEQFDPWQDKLLLDGFPRTIPQAQWLEYFVRENNISDPIIINLTISRDIIMKRLQGRRVCYDCNSIFHLERDSINPSDVCPKCSSELYIRPEDSTERISERLSEYSTYTQPITNYYLSSSPNRPCTVIATVDAGNDTGLVLSYIYDTVE